MSVAKCVGCDPDAGPGYHLQECPFWQSLPTLLVGLPAVGLALADEGPIDPREIVARVFESPRELEAHVERIVKAPPQGASKPTNIAIGVHNVAVANKVTPEMLLAIVANIIATSKSAAIAVARIRLEVLGWTFETSTGDRG